MEEASNQDNLENAVWPWSAASFRVLLKQTSISLALFMNTGRVFFQSLTRKAEMVLQSVHEVSSVALKALVTFQTGFRSVLF